ncbi:MAG: hypothetical protein V3V18_01280 [Methylococcales bacterium]
MKYFLFFTLLLLLTTPLQVNTQTIDEYGCVVVAGKRVPYNFITDLEDRIHFDKALQEHYQKITHALENGEWIQTRARSENDETPIWIRSIPDLESRIEQWRINYSMSAEFKDECH